MSRRQARHTSAFIELPQRRSFLAGATLSGAAIALLAGCGSLMAAGDGSSARRGDETTLQDIAILNSALGAEQEAIAAYQAGVDSGLLQSPVRALAIRFQDHHRQHADLLASTVKRLGGEPAAAGDHYEFPLEQLNAQDDVLAFAAGLEKGAVSAYLGAVPLFGERELAKAAASILGDEAMHWAVLRHALGQDPVPVAFVS